MKNKRYPKVIFVVPPGTGDYGKPGFPHVGMAYLAAFLRKHGIDVSVHDMRLNKNINALKIKIDEFQPYLIAITCVSLEYSNTYKIIEWAKKNYRSKIVVGGPHISAVRDKVLKETSADYAVKGEGEYTLLELCGDKELNDVKGLIWRSENEIIENDNREFITDLDKLPFPAYDLFNLNMYNKQIPIVSSRGCPYQCTYCSVKLSMGRNWRWRSPENVVLEIEHWYSKGFTRFQFTDDCFTLNMDRAKKICGLIISKKLKIEWDLRNGIRVDRVDGELLSKMRKAGCFFVAFGCESGNPEVLKAIKKGITVEEVRNAVILAKKYGFKVGLFFIVGLENETYKRFLDSFNLAKSLPLDEVRFYNSLPYPHTELYDWVEKNGVFIKNKEFYLNDGSHMRRDPIFETEDFSYKERVLALNLSQSYMTKIIFISNYGAVIGRLVFSLYKNNFIWNMIRKTKYVMTFNRD